jgi:hypothetical protein
MTQEERWKIIDRREHLFTEVSRLRKINADNPTENTLRCMQDVVNELDQLKKLLKNN